MSDEAVRVEIEGQPVQGSKGEPTLAELNARADAAERERIQADQERARAFRERDLAVRENIATKAAAWEAERQRAEDARRQALEADRFFLAV